MATVALFWLSGLTARQLNRITRSHDRHCRTCNPRGNPRPVPHARGYHAKTRRRRARR
jgi:hypothetical protein